MDDHSKESVSYLAFESVQVRFERTNRRLWILCIILIIALIGTNVAWLHYENQFAEVESTTEITQENDSGYNNYIGNDGDIYNGETSDKNND